MRDDFGNERAPGAVPTPQTQTQMYTTATTTEPPLEAGKVIAIAGGAAGAIAGLWVLVSERQKKPEPKTTMEQARELIDEAVQLARSESMKAEASLLAGLQGRGETGKKKTQKGRKKALKKVSGRNKRAADERAEMVSRVADMLKGAREDAAKTYAGQAGEMSKLVQQLRSEAARSVEQGRKRSKSQTKQVKKDAERARKEATALAENLKGRAMDAEHQAEHLVGGVALPLIKQLGGDAQHLIEAGKDRTAELRKKAEKDLIPTARKQAEGLRKRAGSDALPQAKKRADDLKKRAESDLLPEAKKRAEEFRKKAEKELIPEAKKAADQLTHALDERTREARKTLGTSSAGAATKLGTTVHAVEEQASEAGEAVKRSGREARSLLLWITLAGVLIFTVFLDENQQKRLKEIAFEIFGEGKDMYDDMKGTNSSMSM